VKFLRPFLHSVFLGCLNFFSILFGFGIYTLLKPANQILIQLPVAIFLSIVTFLLWTLLLPRLRWKEMLLIERKDYLLVLLGALIVTPFVFYPLHYVTQGYVARFSNVLAVWAFQVPVNALALWLAFQMSKRVRVNML